MLVIDRFEGDCAVVETERGLINIPRADLPMDAKEGDTLRLILDADETVARKKRIDGLMHDLFKDG